jgi:hypothetical protein
VGGGCGGLGSGGLTGGGTGWLDGCLPAAVSGVHDMPPVGGGTTSTAGTPAPLTQLHVPLPASPSANVPGGNKSNVPLGGGGAAAQRTANRGRHLVCSPSNCHQLMVDLSIALLEGLQPHESPTCDGW